MGKKNAFKKGKPLDGCFQSKLPSAPTEKPEQVTEPEPEPVPEPKQCYFDWFDDEEFDHSAMYNENTQGAPVYFHDDDFAVSDYDDHPLRSTKAIENEIKDDEEIYRREFGQENPYTVF